MITVAVLAATAGLGLGVFVGWLLNRAWATTAMSRSQERMQRQVRFWQAEAARARPGGWQIDQGRQPGQGG